MENGKGLSVCIGYIELFIVLVNVVGVMFVMVGCVMFSNDGDDFGVLCFVFVRVWVVSCNIFFLIGFEIVKYVLG